MNPNHTSGRRARVVLSLISLTLSFGILGCRTVQVRSLVDPKADFRSYRTFNFAELSASTNYVQLSRQNRTRIQTAVVSEMEGRACRLADQPDLVLAIELATGIQAYDKSNPSVEGGSIGANLSKHYGLVYNENLGSQSVVSYTQGTLLFRAFDTRQNRCVWEGVASGVVHENRPDAEVQQRIQEAVKRVFATYPVKPVGK